MAKIFIDIESPESVGTIDVDIFGATIQGVKGDTGATGKSAYQSALDNGFVGTEAEWLAFLKSANWGEISGDISSQTDLKNAFDGKVDKVEGKGLSKNDFTDELKNKLDNVESGAQKNVNADWNSSSGDSEIKNKPTFATVATSGSYNDLSDKPSWIGTNKPTYDKSEIGLGNVDNVKQIPLSQKG